MTPLSFWFSGLCLGLYYWALCRVDLWLAHVVLGMIWGMDMALIWICDSAISTVEYWHGAYPHWIYTIFRNPRDIVKNANSDVRYIKYYYKLVKNTDMLTMKWRIINKPFALIIAIMISLIFAFRDTEVNIRLIETIAYAIAWLLSVYLSERYFRRKYTRIKDWSRFRPFDELK